MNRNVIFAVFLVIAIVGGYLLFQKSESARMTPAQFGYYITEGSSPLRLLQVLSTAQRDLPLDPPRFLDKPQLIINQGAVGHLVLYERMFSLAAPSEIFVNIVAKVRGEEAWVVRNRGYMARVSPRSDNREILDIMLTNYKPGRYAIGLNNQYYSFSVAGDNNDPDYCVVKKNGAFQNSYVVCEGGTPD